MNHEYVNETYLKISFEGRFGLGGNLDGLSGIFPIIDECRISVDNLLIRELQEFK